MVIGSRPLNARPLTLCIKLLFARWLKVLGNGSCVPIDLRVYPDEGCCEALP